ncbi:MAG: hypothetical protein H2174_05905 [Vampirovibrio sp.]|nr:hypothetical protein [Vampirovibrio sp.]
MQPCRKAFITLQIPTFFKHLPPPPSNELQPNFYRFLYGYNGQGLAGTTIFTDHLKPVLYDAWGNILGDNKRVLFTCPILSIVSHAHNTSVTRHADGFVLQALDNEPHKVRGDGSAVFIKTKALFDKKTYQASRVKPNEPAVCYLENGENKYWGRPESLNALKLPLLHLWQAVKEGGKVIITPNQGASKTISLAENNLKLFPRSFLEGMLQLEWLLMGFNPKLSYLKREHFD